eukprot:85229_1
MSTENCNTKKNVTVQIPARSMSTEKEVLYEVLDGGIALVTLNRPHRMNAITGPLSILYFEYLNKANNDNNVKAIIVTGNGRAFCAGADFKGLKAATESKGQLKKLKNRNKLRDDYSWYTRQIQTLNIHKPLIACINGACAGLGFVTAMFCDIRFVVNGAKITSSFVKRGLVAEHGISFILPRIVGLSNALDILYSSRIIYAQEALQMGLVSKVFNSKKEMMEYALKYTRDIAIWCSPAAIKEIKKQVFKNLLDTPQTSWKEAQKLMIKSFKHPDFKEGVDSYLEKRYPKWKGLNYSEISKL